MVTIERKLLSVDILRRKDETIVTLDTAQLSFLMRSHLRLSHLLYYIMSSDPSLLNLPPDEKIG